MKKMIVDAKQLDFWNKWLKENEIDFDVLWIQLKLVGIPDVDERKDDILLLCGVEKEKTKSRN